LAVTPEDTQLVAFVSGQTARASSISITGSLLLTTKAELEQIEISPLQMIAHDLEKPLPIILCVSLRHTAPYRLSKRARREPTDVVGRHQFTRGGCHSAQYKSVNLSSSRLLAKSCAKASSNAAAAAISWRFDDH
jgi:hypothetical protein